MTDLISRQAAIDALMAWEEVSVWDDECLKHRGEPYWVAPSDVIEQLPTAEPKRGKWVDFSMSATPVPTERCGECGEWSFGMAKDYCPWCGAKMEVEHEV